MNARLVATLALLEARVRLRRPSTLVALFAAALLAWLFIADPAGGHALMASHGARVRYTSSALALGSVAQATVLLALVGFYLLRGRMAEDMRSGLGGVIGASPAGGAAFLLGRWCGGVLYLAALGAAFAATVLVCHAVRGEGPIQPLVYLQTYVLVLGPLVLFTGGCALLFDSWPPLMGKTGDVLYFLTWPAQVGMLATATKGVPVVLPIDFMGMTAILSALSAALDVHDTMIGLADFDRSLAPLTLPVWLWTPALVALRAVSALLALTPLLLALRVFHRFSPDLVKPARARARRTPLALVDGWLRPLTRLAQPLFALAGRMPGMAGQVLADVALTLAATPSAIALLLLAQVLALALDRHALPPFALAAVTCWGVLISDVPTRDGAAACAALTAATPGGAARRYWRQLAASLVLGLLFTGVAALRLAVHEAVRAGALLAGLFALAALASLLGRASGSARTFLVLFLFGLYLCLNVNNVAAVDAIGFHGAATVASALGWLVAGMLAALGGHVWNRHAARV
jgi:hypothetical protein